MNIDYQFAKRQFNRCLIIAASSILNDNLQDWWQGSQNLTHFKIELQRILSLSQERCLKASTPFKIISHSQKKIFFSPSSSITAIEIELSEEHLFSLDYLKGKKICALALDKYRYLFFCFLEIFLQNSPRGSNPEAHLAKINNNNPMFFTLLKDHTEKVFRDEALCLKTLQKQCERYKKKNGYPSKRTAFIKHMIRKR